MQMKNLLVGLISSAVLGTLFLCGCETNQQPDASRNAAMAAPYQEGTGVGSSGYNVKPRFYTGPNGANDQSPSTQPAGH
jgi:hypothetical protein